MDVGARFDVYTLFIINEDYFEYGTGGFTCHAPLPMSFSQQGYWR